MGLSAVLLSVSYTLPSFTLHLCKQQSEIVVDEAHSGLVLQIR